MAMDYLLIRNSRSQIPHVSAVAAGIFVFISLLGVYLVEVFLYVVPVPDIILDYLGAAVNSVSGVCLG